MFGDIKEAALNLFFPPLCVICKKYLRPPDRIFQLCPSCYSSVERNHPPFCRKCSRPLVHQHRSHCRTCEETAPLFDRGWAPLIYNETGQHLLHLFKYGNRTGLRRFFIHEFINFYQSYQPPWDHVDLLVPIPLSPARKRERGYNQSEILAEHLSRTLHIPLSTRHLLRARHMPNQATLCQKERWTNISGAFRIKQPEALNAKNILLVDDLYTTGATCSEAAKILKANGADKVYVLTLAVARLEKEMS